MNFKNLNKQQKSNNNQFLIFLDLNKKFKDSKIFMNNLSNM